MDTRNKILTGDAAGLLPGANRCVAGYFDPLLPSHVRRLQEAGDSLIVVVLDRPGALMPVRARAELIAALSCVRSVLTEVPAGARVESWEEADALDAQRFIEYVRQRCE